METQEQVLANGIFSKNNLISMFFYIIAIACVWSGMFLQWIACFFVAIIAFDVGLFLQISLSRCELTVTDRRVFGRAAFGNRVDLPFDMISFVGTSVFKGICVATSSGRIKFYLCKNREQVFDVISNLLTDRQRKAVTPVQAAAKESIIDKLTKYKRLLDGGVITQEEFVAKKKQLLGL